MLRAQRIDIIAQAIFLWNNQRHHILFREPNSTPILGDHLCQALEIILSRNMNRNVKVLKHYTYLSDRDNYKVFLNIWYHRVVRILLSNFYESFYTPILDNASQHAHPQMQSKYNYFYSAHFMLKIIHVY